MRVLYPIILYTMVLTLFSELHSVKIRNGATITYQKKDWLFYSALALGLAVFVGLRTKYNDTSAYIHSYQMLNETFDWGRIHYKLGSNPGFNLVSMFLRSRHASAQSFLMVFALATVLIYLWFIRKYTHSIGFSVFLFLSLGVYTFAMAAIKQTLAVAFCLVATDRAIRKKYIPFVFWVLVASTFHPYALMYLVVPLLSFQPWSSRTVILLIATGIAGISLQLLIGTIVNITTLLGEEYSEMSFQGNGVNVFRFLVVSVPVVLSFFVKDRIREYDSRAMNIIINLTMVNMMIMFIALFGTAIYFGRLANYFLFFQTISLPFIIRQFDSRNRSVLTIGAIIGYSIYFIYAHAFLYGGFDGQLKYITLSQYLSELFS